MMETEPMFESFAIIEAGVAVSEAKMLANMEDNKQTMSLENEDQSQRSETDGSSAAAETGSNQMAASDGNVSSSSKSVDLKSFTCRSDRLELSFSVRIENSTALSQQRCHVMTIHDLGSDSSKYDSFVHCDKMSELKSRVVWLHVTLPGQEAQSPDLAMRKYPTLEELAGEIVCIVDFLKIPQVVCMGEGVGASIATLFAIKHANRCLGCVLIEPSGREANLIESIRFKLSNFSLLGGGKQSNNTNNHGRNGNNGIMGRERATSSVSTAMFRFDKLVSRPFGSMSGNSDTKTPLPATNTNTDSGSFNETSPLNESNLINDSKCLLDHENLVATQQYHHNPKNLQLFAESYLNRSCLLEKLKELKVDALIAVGKNSTHFHDTKKFYQAMQASHKQEPQKLVNSPFLEIDNVVNILCECPERLAISFQYFLQGIGLIPALPMRNVLRQASLTSGSYGRSLSIDESTSSDHSLN